MILALTIALLIGSAVYLIQQRGLVHIVLGMMAFGHGANPVSYTHLTLPTILRV